MRIPTVNRRGTSYGAAALVLGALVFWLLAPGAPTASAQEPEPVRIDVTLDEFSFAPEPLRVPAGRPVTLVIRNVGKVPHEFMAGRDPKGDDFGTDLFADLHVNIEQAETPEPSHGGHDGHDADAGHGDHHDVAESDAQGHAHGAGHAHGTMVEAQAGQTFLMTFTLPEDRRGEWITGCFLSGHYEAGMHGTLIVE